MELTYAVAMGQRERTAIRPTTPRDVTISAGE